MPLTKLSFWTNGGGREYPVQAALDLAAQGDLHGWTFELLSALLAEQQDRGKRISTTLLTTKCLRSEVLSRLNDYTDDPRKLWASFRGTMFHGRLERHAHSDSIAEARYWVTLPNGDELSGSPDLVNVRLGILDDYKTNKENPKYGKPWPGHVKQVQINRWLVDHAHRVEWQGSSYELWGFDAEISGEDLTANRAMFVPKQWTALRLIHLDDKGPAVLPVEKSVDVPQVGDPSKTKKARVADIWSDSVVEKLVMDLYVEVKAALDADEPPPIPAEFTRQAHPLCGYCPVRERCWELAMVGK